MGTVIVSLINAGTADTGTVVLCEGDVGADTGTVIVVGNAAGGVGVEITTPAGDIPSWQTTMKPNYHACVFAEGKWWILAWDNTTTTEWFLYRRDAENDYVKLDGAAAPGELDTRGSTQPTMFLLSSGKLFVGITNTSGADSWLLTYNATDDDWDVDSGWPKDSANNGLEDLSINLGVFRDANDKIYCVNGDASGLIKINTTADHGTTWAAASQAGDTIRDTGDSPPLASNTTHICGCHFTWSAVDYVGFGYSQNTSGEVGFAYCAISANPLLDTSWTFESLTGMTGLSAPDDHVAVTAAHSGANAGMVFLVMKASDGSHHIAERTAGTGGSWTNHEVTETTLSRPGIVYDADGDTVYVHVGEGTSGTKIEYLTWTPGSIASHSAVADLITDGVSTAFQTGFTTYDNFSAESDAFFIAGQGGASGELWERSIAIEAAFTGGGAPCIFSCSNQTSFVAGGAINFSTFPSLANAGVHTGLTGYRNLDWTISFSTNYSVLTLPVGSKWLVECSALISEDVHASIWDETSDVAIGVPARRENQGTGTSRIHASAVVDTTAGARDVSVQFIDSDVGGDTVWGPRTQWTVKRLEDEYESGLWYSHATTSAWSAAAKIPFEYEIFAPTNWPTAPSWNVGKDELTLPSGHEYEIEMAVHCSSADYWQPYSETDTAYLNDPRMFSGSSSSTGNHLAKWSVNATGDVDQVISFRRISAVIYRNRTWIRVRVC